MPSLVELSEKAWPILTRAAAERRTLTYEELAERLRSAPVLMGKALTPLQNHCLARGLPPLPILVVSKETGLPREMAAWEGTFPDARRYVWDHDWSATPPPTLARLKLMQPASAAVLLQRTSARTR